MKPDFSLSPDARLALAEELRAGTLMEPNITSEMRADLARCMVEEIAVPTREGPARALRVSPPSDLAAPAPRPLFINLHGGGFVRPYHERDTIFCAQMALALGCEVLDIDYRLAPEHPFPTSVNESYDIVAWAFENADALDVDAKRIAMGGHSAGGTLTAVTCMTARETGAFELCGQVLDYPFTDGVTPPEDKLDPRSVMPADRMHAFNVLYAGVEENLANPRLSPIFADRDLLVGQPPALLLIAGMDPLRHEAQRYAARLIDADVDVEVHQFARCDHGFTITARCDWERARALIFDWLGRRFARAADL